MGYYTQYALTVDSEDREHHESRILEESGYSSLEDGIKWYSHDEQLKAYSKANPGITFTLDGDGEEIGDVWRKWYRNGEVQEWRLVVERPSNPPKEWTA